MKVPVTMAVRTLRHAGIDFVPHLYRYEPGGGATAGAAALGVDPHLVIKTLIMETEDGDPLIVLMHGDREVSTKKLARLIGCRRVRPCDPDVANRHSGYLVGGTSPFGTRRTMPAYAPGTLLEVPVVYLNGGSRGFLVELSPAAIVSALDVTLGDITAE
jgi:Cys-tRNA(Pro) deacylase